LITSASLDEVSLTPMPANPDARILHRFPQSPAVQFYDHARDFVACLQRLGELIKDDVVRRRAVAAVDVDRHQEHRAVSRPKTEFRKLVEAINEQHA
jgi:hypothetical protein